MKIIVINAHADDGNVATGGVIHRMIQEGNEVFYVVFSIAEDSVPTGFEKDVVEKECFKSTCLLGISKENITIFRYPVRRLNEYRQKILDDLIKIKNHIKPDICFTPSTMDIHQDHNVVCNETIRAFWKTSTIYGYDFPWNILYTPKLNIFFEISKEDLNIKMMAIQEYKSQLVKPNNCLTNEYLKSLAIIRGNMIGTQYAEAFEAIRVIRRIKHE